MRGPDGEGRHDARQRQRRGKAPTAVGRPVLVLGAANAISGALAKFVSRWETIRVEHILASCAVPSIFPAV